MDSKINTKNERMIGWPSLLCMKQINLAESKAENVLLSPVSMDKGIYLFIYLFGDEAFVVLCCYAEIALFHCRCLSAPVRGAALAGVPTLTCTLSTSTNISGRKIPQSESRFMSLIITHTQFVECLTAASPPSPAHVSSAPRQALEERSGPVS